MTKAQAGMVYLVGAGPGDPELLTRKAAALLETADVILHDDLVPREILAVAGNSALVVNVGKRCGKKRVSQAGINSMMIESARKGMSVVRLKSGDPLIFGRASEELRALKAAGIACEIVPGITAALSAAAAGGFSLTDRRTASRVVFATGHFAEDQAKSGYWHGLADPETTVVIYMPGPDLGRLSAQLIGAGFAPETPCRLVSRAGHSGQCDQQSPLHSLHQISGLEAPVILIVGSVTAALQGAEELLPGLSATGEGLGMLEQFLVAASREENS